MNEEDINFLISIQDLEQPEFDNACLERENERLRKELQQKENIIKEVREEVKEARLWNWTEQKILIDKFTKRLLEILDKENK